MGSLFAPRSLLLRYGVALVVPWIALGIRVALTPYLGEQSPLMVFILAGAVAAWWGGFLPGLLAFVLGLAISMWYFILPLRSFMVESVPERTRLLSYLVVGIVVSAMAEALHRSLRRAKRQEKIHREIGERYRAFLSTSHEAIWRIELDEPIPTDLPVEEQVRLYFARAYYAEVNDALARLYGFERAEDVPGLRVSAVEPPNRVETVDSMIHFVRSGYRRADEVSFEQDRHGEPRNFLNNYVGIVENGRLVRLWGSSLDITAHQRAETALRESEATLKAFYETSPALMGMAELGEHDILHVYDNPATCRLLGLAPGRTAGRWSTELGITSEIVGIWLQRYRQAVDSGSSVSFELGHSLPGHRAYWLASTVVHIGTGPTGRPRCCYVSLDITARHRFEEDLAQARDRAEAASRAKDDFLAALSHELRNPLNPVLLTASAALMDPALSADERSEWEMVHRNIALQARLIDDLLDLTRITRGKLSLEMQSVDVHQLLREALATVRADLSVRHLACDLALEASNIHLQGDAARLQQVFWNILKNAVKFTPEGGTIRIQTRNPDGNGLLRVAISDTGIGLTPAELGRIFDAFVQGEHAERRGAHRFGGLGLGLAISQQIVQLHAGRIWAESPGREQGATFYVELPTSPAAPDLPVQT